MGNYYQIKIPKINLQEYFYNPEIDKSQSIIVIIDKIDNEVIVYLYNDIERALKDIFNKMQKLEKACEDIRLILRDCWKSIRISEYKKRFLTVKGVLHLWRQFYKEFLIKYNNVFVCPNNNWS